MDEEALRSLILATSPSTPGSADGSSSLSLDKVHGIGSLSTSLPTRMPGSSQSSFLPNYPTSPRRNVRARSYAGLRLCRAARNVSKCRAIANIKVTAEPPKATRNIVPVLHLEDEVLRLFPPDSTLSSVCSLSVTNYPRTASTDVSFLCCLAC